MKYEFLISKLKTLVASERKITAEIIDLIREVDQKRIYLEYGHTSMFSMLTKDFGYSPSAAMRRIDAARLSKELPDIGESLKSGELNLSQVSMMAQAVRQKEKEEKSGFNKNGIQSKASDTNKVSKETKALLLEKVKSLDLVATQKVLTKDLDLKVKVAEKKTYQQDGSVRVEATLEQETYANIERVKELISHQYPNATLSEVVDFLANHFLNQKDPLRKDQTRKGKFEKDQLNKYPVRKLQKEEKIGSRDRDRNLTTAPVPASRQNQGNSAKANEDIRKKTRLATKPKTIPVKIRVEVFKRDQCCQWVETVKNNKGEQIKRKCQSKFQLQVDHIKPRWQDGSNNLENLQLLCGIHNRLKYQHEIIGQTISK